MLDEMRDVPDELRWQVTRVLSELYKLSLDEDLGIPTTLIGNVALDLAAAAALASIEAREERSG